MINFADARTGLRLVYPVEWHESDVAAQNSLLVLTRGEDETFSIVAQSTDQGDLKMMEQRAVEKYRTQFQNFELLESSPASLGGVPARRIVFRGNAVGRQFQMMNVMAVRNATAFAVVYSAEPATFKSNRADAQKLIDSIRLTN